MNTTENNKLIAEFMGWREIYENANEFDYEVKDDTIYHRLDLKDLEQYHTSWDWLMPVVEKITNMDEFQSPKEPKDWKEKNPYKVYGNSIDSILYTDIASALIRGTDKELLYEAVVEFIKWYNENKED